MPVESPLRSQRFGDQPDKLPIPGDFVVVFIDRQKTRIELAGDQLRAFGFEIDPEEVDPGIGVPTQSDLLRHGHAALIDGAGTSQRVVTPHRQKLDLRGENHAVGLGG